MKRYRVVISMWPDQEHDVDAAELVDLRAQHLLVGEPVELDDEGNPVASEDAAEPDQGEQGTPEPDQTAATGKPAGRKAATDRKAGE